MNQALDYSLKKTPATCNGSDDESSSCQSQGGEMSSHSASSCRGDSPKMTAPRSTTSCITPTLQTPFFNPFGYLLNSNPFESSLAASRFLGPLADRLTGSVALSLAPLLGQTPPTLGVVPSAATSVSASRTAAVSLLGRRRRRYQSRASNDEPSTASERPAGKKERTSSDDERGDAYWERRRKNNEAAKRSREVRRAKEEEIALRAAYLEQENMKLKAQVAVLKNESARLHCMLISHTQTPM
uniref:BZIP domain-containing protein n=1 Tax=Trichuris muris TaxID=70415 RepID=A0A5S6R4C5_TRIMR